MSWLLSLVTGGAMKWWLIGGVAVAVAGYVGSTQMVLHNRQKALDASIAEARQLAADKATLTGQLDQVQELNRRNLETLARVRADHDRAMADVAADLARARKAGTRLTVVMQENARDPDAARPLGESCPLLDRYFDRSLRDGGGAAAADRDRNPAGRDQAPRGAAAVP